MKLALLLLVLVASCSATIDVGRGLHHLWSSYKTNFSKVYETAHHEAVAQKAFFHNLERIKELRQAHQAKVGTSADHIYGINKFSDVDPQDFRRRYLGYKPQVVNKQQPIQIQGYQRTAPALPTSFDWFAQGACTPVKDQGQCGSCWAFSATEEIESMYKIQNGELYTLAPQQIVSCDTTDGGCSGGEPMTAYQYVQSAGGLVPESDDPYYSGSTGDNGVCNITSSDEIVTVTGYTYAITPCDDSCSNQDESQLQQQLYSTGPISVCVDAESWQYYTGGVLQSNCPSDYNDIDHCVQLTGYDQSSSPGYWIVRNSWNTDWGEAGFIYVQMGSNLCGIADTPTFVQTTAA